ncbi:MAG: FAD binding domain-containing protein [Firmicutes bacterium]|nr:FAD binding domain-containing protein [Bacillota bacterium]
MNNLKEFYYPENIAEAQKLLRDESVKKAIIAGGTSVALLNTGSVEGMVDITRMGLNYIKQDGGFVKIGATAVVEELARSPITKNLANGILAKASSEIASRPLRNMITMGGNIVQLRIWSDLPVVLLALDGQIKVQGDEERTIPADDFFREQPLKTLAHFDIVKEVVLPKTPETSGAEFIKLSKTKGDYAIMSLACYLEFEEKTCTLARIALSSVTPLPRRCKKAEKVLEGKQLTPELIAEAAAVTREKTKTISNIWGSAEYKSVVLENLVKKSLLSCADKAGIQI